MTVAALALLALLQQPAAPDSGAGRPCTIMIDSIGGNYRQAVPTPGDTNSGWRS